ncbi:hypothetical protein PPBDW_II1380 [Photobacterium kishitanii]|nr:hypothetical protein PPBDW_II1380 [Photobacterium kishitanii]
MVITPRKIDQNAATKDTIISLLLITSNSHATIKPRDNTITH